MIGNEIQHQSQVMPLKLGAKLAKALGAAQRFGHGVIRHGEGRTDDPFLSARPKSFRALRSKVWLCAGEIAAFGAGGPHAHEPDMRETAFLPGSDFFLRRRGQRHGPSETIRQRAQPAARVDFKKQRVRHQLFKSFMAFLASETRKIIKPFLASGSVAQ